MWNRFLNFEYTFGGDGSLLDSSEKRWAESKHMEARRAELPCLLHRESRTGQLASVYHPTHPRLRHATDDLKPYSCVVWLLA